MNANTGAGRERNRRRLAAALACSLGLMALAGAAPASADYYDGITAYENQDYTRAQRELLPLAEAGDARAQRLVGLMYRDGQGVRRDDIRAYMWLELAARRGQFGAAESRDELGQRMAEWQVAEARKMADGWSQTAGVYSGSDYSRGSSIDAEDLPEPSYDAGGLDRQELADLQWQLAVHGYDPGASDGRVGPRTVAAIRDYQADAGLRVDGRPSMQLLEHLQYADPPVRNTRVARTYEPPPYQPPAYDEPPAAYQQDDGSDPESAFDSPIGIAPSLTTVYTLTVQEELAARGYYRGPLDGIAGRGTRAGILRYQRENGLEPTGEVSLELVNHLRLVTVARAP